MNVVKFLLVAATFLFLQSAFAAKVFCAKEERTGLKVGQTNISCDDAYTSCYQVTYLGGDFCNVRYISSEKEIEEYKALNQEENTEEENTEEEIYPVEKDSSVKTEFLRSCMYADSEKHLHLLGSAMDVNESGNNGNTCLHLLAYGGWWNQMRTIQENGGDITLENDNGDTPGDILRWVMIHDKNDAKIMREFVYYLTE